LIPRTRHVTRSAGQAWAACRSGECDADRFGHGKTTGLWFVKVNVVRDHYAINNREIWARDGWRAAPQSKQVVSEQDWAFLDNIAALPEQAIAETRPNWTT
jgi:hypothetical protein